MNLDFESKLEFKPVDELHRSGCSISENIVGRKFRSSFVCDKENFFISFVHFLFHPRYCAVLDGAEPRHNQI